MILAPMWSAVMKVPSLQPRASGSGADTVEGAPLKGILGGSNSEDLIFDFLQQASRCAEYRHALFGLLSRAFGAVTVATAQRLGGGTLMVKENNNVRYPRVKRAGDIVLIDHPADDTGPAHY